MNITIKAEYPDTNRPGCIKSIRWPELDSEDPLVTELLDDLIASKPTIITITPKETP